MRFGGDGKGFEQGRAAWNVVMMGCYVYRIGLLTVEELISDFMGL